jgi:transcriptional regulator with XRE-family HTH domain
MTLTLGNDHPSFGTLLKGYRKRRRLTQQQLADALEMHRNAVGRWEQGDFLPASKTIVRELARQLRLDEVETRALLEASLTALSPHWSVPWPRNAYFTGREPILEALRLQLGRTKSVALTQSSALSGLGGVGKTQIALEYAYRYALDYNRDLLDRSRDGRKHHLQPAAHRRGPPATGTRRAGPAAGACRRPALAHDASRLVDDLG